MDWLKTGSRLRQELKKYRWAALVVLLGIGLMLIPALYVYLCGFFGWLGHALGRVIGRMTRGDRVLGAVGLALCTVLIVLLISAMLAVGVRFAVRTYRESMELSETDLLCSTLTAAISDKLRYSGEVGQNMFIQGVGTTDSGGGGSFAISDDGEVVIQTTDSKEFRLLGSASYPQGLRVRTTGTGETGFISYSAETGIFTVSFAIADAQGNILKETCFDVKRINAVKK